MVPGNPCNQQHAPKLTCVFALLGKKIHVKTFGLNLIIPLRPNLCQTANILNPDPDQNTNQYTTPKGSRLTPKRFCIEPLLGYAQMNVPPLRVRNCNPIVCIPHALKWVNRKQRIFSTKNRPDELKEMDLPVFTSPRRSLPGGNLYHCTRI